MFVGIFWESFINLKTKISKQFFDNMKFMGDLPFTIYFDLEAATGKKVYNFDEDATLYPVSYAFVIAFHPSLNIEKGIGGLKFESHF